MFEGSNELAFGVAGGVVAEAVQWFGLRFTLHKGLPPWSRSWLYWAVTLVMVAVGGGLAYVYAISGTKLSPLLALNVGASAPLILGKLINQVPPIEPGRVG